VIAALAVFLSLTTAEASATLRFLELFVNR
jgi:hypothetical protein